MSANSKSMDAYDAYLENTYYEPSYTHSKGDSASEATDLNNSSSGSSDPEATQPTEISKNHASANSIPKAPVSNPDPTPTTPIPQDSVFYKAAKKSSRGKVSWKKVTQGGVTGIVLGTAAALLWPNDANADDGGEVIEDPEGELGTGGEDLPPVGADTGSVDEGGAHMGDASHDSSLSSMVDSGMSWAHGVSDDMSYAEAFSAARAEVGPGGVFEWRGQLYGTYYGNEWDAMSPEERDDFNHHFSWSHETTTSAADSHMAEVDDDSDSIPEDDLLASVDDDEIDPIPDGDIDSIPDGDLVPDDDDSIPGDDLIPEVDEDVDLISDDDIEILGVSHDESTGMTYGAMSVAGQEYLLIDVEDDGDRKSVV